MRVPTCARCDKPATQIIVPVGDKAPHPDFNPVNLKRGRMGYRLVCDDHIPEETLVLEESDFEDE